MTKILCLSDTHNSQNLLNLPEAEILIHAGDLTGRGTEQEFLKVASWMNNLRDRYEHIVFIAGNHDFGLQDNKDKILSMFEDDIIYLDHSSVNINGLNIFGSPYTPPFFDWAFMKDEYVLTGLYRSIPEDTDILVTHGPPHSILDKTMRGEHVGSIALYNRVKELSSLKHHVFGHIHLQGGKEEKIGNTVFHNVAVADEQYRMTNPLTIIEV